jgi:hypothetical protein
MFKSIYAEQTSYSRIDGLCTAVGSVVRTESGQWMTLRTGSVRKIHQTREQAEAELEAGFEVIRAHKFS